MQAPFGPHEPCTDHPVWKALSDYIVGPADAALPFVVRLARENGWSRGHADRVLEEYRRFCFLAVTCGHAVTPSDAVDQAWHLHLSYTRDYWERFCPQVLGRPLHHGPTAGGPAEQHRFFLQYAETLRSYARVFGPPPADLWPDAGRRLNQDHKARRIHPRDGILLPRRPAIVLGLVLALLLAAGLAALFLAWSGHLNVAWTF